MSKQNDALALSNSPVKALLSQSKKPGTLAGLKATELAAVFDSMKGQIAQALPKHLSAERMIQMAASVVSRNTRIAECKAASIIGSIMQASILGFSPIEALGECFFVPYKTHTGDYECRFQIGYKGYIKLARRSRQISTIYAEVVYKDDTFHYELGLEPKLIHQPDLAAEPDDRNIIYAYAVAHYRDGGYNFVVLTRKQIESLRQRSPSQRKGLDGPWATDYAAMSRAKAIKQLAKYLPLEESFFMADASDEQVLTPDKFRPDGSGVQIDSLEYTSHDDLDIEEPLAEAPKQLPEKSKPAPKVVRGKAPAIEEEEGVEIPVEYTDVAPTAPQSAPNPFLINEP